MCLCFWPNVNDEAVGFDEITIFLYPINERSNMIIIAANSVHATVGVWFIIVCKDKIIKCKALISFVPIEISAPSEWIVYELVAINGEWKQPTATLSSGQRKIKNILPLSIHGRQNARFFPAKFLSVFQQKLKYKLNWFNADGCESKATAAIIKRN